MLQRCAVLSVWWCSVTCDDRVLGALGLEARAPFPKGHDVPAGEWDLMRLSNDVNPFIEWWTDRAVR
ncbi:MAG: hypothetical protein CM15mP120_00260 [Pseudomonadota bacterium]|nr:MAG: hypothetical protein CM15mP120_00260 [Pseudomonadota bacterium]